MLKICKFCNSQFSTDIVYKLYCTRKCSKKFYYSNPKNIEAKKKSDSKHYEKNRDKILERTKNYKNSNKEYYRQYLQSYRSTQNLDTKRLQSRNWVKRNRAYCTYNTALYRAKKALATPSWITRQHLQEIKNIYKTAKELQSGDGIVRHVDHIIPINGKIVCGLHVPWNLQILTAQENCKKSNTHGR